jgi:acyl carrier protein
MVNSVFFGKGLAMEDLQFAQFAEFIRESCVLGRDQRIDPDTQFERDLGVTGGDGDDLLEAVEKRFGVKLTRESFNLEPNECLFGSDAAFPDLLEIFGRRPTTTVRSFTVGELFEVVRSEIEKSQ